MSEKARVGFKPADAAAIAFSVLVVAAVWIFMRVGSRSAGFVEVTAPSGNFVYPLDEDGIYEFDGEMGKFAIEVKAGEIHVTETHCPNGSCALGGISSSGESIICLPNRVSVSVSGGNAADAVSY